MPGIAVGSPDEFQVQYCYLKCVVYREMEFHMKNSNIQDHPCGTYEEVYALALQRTKLFSYYLSRGNLYSVEMRGNRAPSPAYWPTDTVCGKPTPRLLVPDGLS